MRKAACMHFRFWRPSLSGERASPHLFVRAAALAVVVSALTTSVFFARPAAAATTQPPQSAAISVQPQYGSLPFLETFMVAQGKIVHRSSTGDGATWSTWISLPPIPDSSSAFVGTPGVVFDGVAGRLTVFARDTHWRLWFNRYDNGAWAGTWGLVPGLIDTDNGPALWNVRNSSDYWFIESDPAVTSWGPGRMDVFVTGYDPNNGAWGLLHGWIDNNTWKSPYWEVLGTGPLDDSHPAATSLGVGHIDVFVRDYYDGSLLHKWF